MIVLRFLSDRGPKGVRVALLRKHPGNKLFRVNIRVSTKIKRSKFYVCGQIYVKITEDSDTIIES